MTLVEAIATLDRTIPHPQSKMVDAEHLQIAVAWDTIKGILIEYDYEKDRYDTMMNRWNAQVEVIRSKIDRKTLTDDDRRLLDELGMPHHYDRRTR